MHIKGDNLGATAEDNRNNQLENLEQNQAGCANRVLTAQAPRDDENPRATQLVAQPKRVLQSYSEFQNNVSSKVDLSACILY